MNTEQCPICQYRLYGLPGLSGSNGSYFLWVNHLGIWMEPKLVQAINKIALKTLGSVNVEGCDVNISIKGLIYCTI